MKNYFLTLLMSVFIVNSLHAQEDVEAVVVTSSLTSSALSEIEDPLHVVDGDELDSSPTQSLGESLDTLLGVSSQDYGAAVGQPVIRGMTGVRVRILIMVLLYKMFLQWVVIILMKLILMVLAKLKWSEVLHHYYMRKVLLEVL